MVTSWLLEPTFCATPAVSLVLSIVFVELPVLETAVSELIGQ